MGRGIQAVLLGTLGLGLPGCTKAQPVGAKPPHVAATQAPAASPTSAPEVPAAATETTTDPSVDPPLQEAAPPQEAAPLPKPPLRPKLFATPTPGEVLLYDPSVHFRCCRESPAESRRILDLLYSKRFALPLDCPSDPMKSLEESLAAGHIAPRVSAREAGSFTRPGAVEVLAVVNLGVCNASRVDWDHAEIVILNGDEIVLRAPYEANGIGRVFDVDADGLLDVVLTHAHGGAGGGGELAWVVSLADGRVSVIADLGGVLSVGYDERDVHCEKTPTWVLIGPSPAFHQLPESLWQRC